ncbi:hypothetical protein ATANTOWER_023012 [Ataeniobius toweri]|uniref:Neurotransmitter-gated ion-channel ligand-binding domain-containing protein n=1 Tax=Ataeniobius toweri TaxID=208326 RepID=A0ABU7A8G6_9TELE|nr:hypothetical protein [Ataeniobius toweri]
MAAITGQIRVKFNMDTFLIICGILFFTCTGASETERRLLQKLFQDYNVKVRPARHWKERVMVRVGMTLSQLIGLVNMHNH